VLPRFLLLRELSKPVFLRNKTNQEIKSEIGLVNNRPFNKEITKILEQNLNGVEVIREEEYVSRVEAQTKEDLKDVVRTSVNFVPVVRIISTGATVIDGAVKDYNNGNFDNTIKNSVQIIAPKVIAKKIGIPENISEGVAAGILLGEDLSE
jgi:hypothetical protein